MKIIVINGSGGAGKDTFMDYCMDTDYANYIYRFSMIDGVKEIARQVGWNGSKELKDRKFLSDLKDLLDKYNNFAFNYTIEDIEYALWSDNWYNNLDNMLNTKKLILFVCAREPKDIQTWVDIHKAKTLLIRRAAVNEQKYGNHADDCVEDYKYDYIIENNGSLEELKEKATNFINTLATEHWESLPIE